MPQTFNENSSTDITCIIDFTNKVDKTAWLKTYESVLYCSCKELPTSVIENEDLWCRIVCFLNDYLTEPTENSVAVYSGGFCDMGSDKPVQMTLLEKIEFKGDPTNSTFDEIAPPPSCATIHSVGKIVPQPKGTVASLPEE